MKKILLTLLGLAMVNLTLMAGVYVRQVDFGADILKQRYMQSNDCTPEIINMSDRHRSKTKTDNYDPMFEIGKEWRYTLHDCSVFNDDHEPDIDRIYRIDGIENINGRDYYVMNTYSGGSHVPDSGTPYGYFREDVVERRVYFLNNASYDAAPMETALLPKDMGEEYVLYDFNSGITGYSDPAILEVNGNSYNGFREERATPNYGIFEVLGLVAYPERSTSPWELGAYDVTGFCLMPMNGVTRYFPFLYSIVGADGTVLYRNDDNGQNSLHVPAEDATNVTPAEYYTLQGVKIDGCPDVPGVYIRRQNNEVTKNIIK